MRGSLYVKNQEGDKFSFKVENLNVVFRNFSISPVSVSSQFHFVLHPENLSLHFESRASEKLDAMSFQNVTISTHIKH